MPVWLIPEAYVVVVTVLGRGLGVTFERPAAGHVVTTEAPAI